MPLEQGSGSTENSTPVGGCHVTCHATVAIYDIEHLPLGQLAFPATVTGSLDTDGETESRKELEKRGLVLIGVR